jgi:hypothetical protein
VRVNGKKYFYVLNRLPVAVEAELSVAGAVVDLVTGKNEGANGALRLALQPYDLRVFRAGSMAGVVTGSRAVTPEAFVRDLERRLNTVKQRLAALRANGEDITLCTPYLDRARELLKADPMGSVR